jgi:CubicO group peptidase (beta-lactamase class C family)
MILIASIISLSSIAAAKEKTGIDLKGFDAWVEKVMKDWKVPGLAIVVVKDGKTAFAKGYGFRDVEKKLPVTPDTLFAIGSSTKAFTATTLGILVDQGKLDWWKPVRDYLPDFKLYNQFATENMTLIDLLSHRSGLPRHDLVWYGSSASRKELYDRLRYLKPSAGFRETWQYQNLMFMTGGYLTEKILGITWEDAVKKLLFEPLGMSASNFSIEVMKKTDDFSLPYQENKEGKIILMPFRNIDNIGPAGSINSSVNDLSKWLLLNLNKGKAGDIQIISESSLAVIHSPQMLMQSSPVLEAVFSPGFNAYGLGWMISTYRDHRIIHHGGNIDGFSALITFAPNDKTGIAVLTNLNGNVATFIVSINLYERIFGLSQTDWNKRGLEMIAKNKAEVEKKKTEADKDRKQGTHPSHPIEEYAGEFENPGYGVMTIALKDGKLSGIYNGIAFDIEHYHYDVFTLSGEDFEEPMKAVFYTDIKGNISAIETSLEDSVDPIRFKRLPERSMMNKEFLQKFTGKYELIGIVVAVTLKGENTLFVTVPGQPDYELVPYKGTEFNLKNLQGYSVEFTEENGKVTKLVFKQPNGNFEAKRIE